MPWSKDKTKGESTVPPFAPVPTKLLKKPTIYKGYGTFKATSHSAVHTLEVQTLSYHVPQKTTRRAQLVKQILRGEVPGSEDYKLWEHFLNSHQATHSLNFWYSPLSQTGQHAQTIEFSMLNLRLNFAVPGYDTVGVAQSCAEFLVYIAESQTEARNLVSTNLLAAELWLIYAFTRYRHYWVETGLISKRLPVDHVYGYWIKDNLDS